MVRMGTTEKGGAGGAESKVQFLHSRGRPLTLVLLAARGPQVHVVAAARAAGPGRARVPVRAPVPVLVWVQAVLAAAGATWAQRACCGPWRGRRPPARAPLARPQTATSDRGSSREH